MSSPLPLTRRSWLQLTTALRNTLRDLLRGRDLLQAMAELGAIDRFVTALIEQAGLPLFAPELEVEGVPVSVHLERLERLAEAFGRASAPPTPITGPAKRRVKVPKTWSATHRRIVREILGLHSGGINIVTRMLLHRRLELNVNTVNGRVAELIAGGVLRQERPAKFRGHRYHNLKLLLPVEPAASHIALDPSEGATTNRVASEAHRAAV